MPTDPEAVGNAHPTKMNPDEIPPPPNPLDYVRATPPPVTGPARFLPTRRTRRIIRITYLIICAVLMFFAVRYLMHYRQILDDAMNPKR